MTSFSKHYGLTLLEVSGVTSAIRGMRYSHNSEASSDSTPRAIGPKDAALMLALCKSGPSHSAFMRMITLHWNMNMPLHFWKQFDTYRFGVEKRSRSTMHTIMQRPLRADDFTSDVYTDVINGLNEDISSGDFESVINNLPCGFLQERIVMTSLSALRNIFLQRVGHKNPAWTVFCSDVIYEMGLHPRLRELVTEL